MTQGQDHGGTGGGHDDGRALPPRAGPSRAAKIVITGTGRAGTTLLVQLLTDLGLDTGYQPEARVDADTRAGLERDILAPDAPRVVKSPGLSAHLRGLLDRGLVEIEHVVIPVRDLDVAVASRVRAAGYGRRIAAAGGLWGTRSASGQRRYLAETLYELVATVVDHDLPHTFLAFPRFAEDSEYTYRKLGFLVPESSPEDFRDALARRVRPDFIHESALDRAERWRSRMMTPVTLTRRAVARIGRLAGARSARTPAKRR